MYSKKERSDCESRVFCIPDAFLPKKLSCFSLRSLKPMVGDRINGDHFQKKQSDFHYVKYLFGFAKIPVQIFLSLT